MKINFSSMANDREAIEEFTTYTTAEIVIGATEEFRFLRTFDSEALLQTVEQTRYQELEIESPPFHV
jgi:hypothetical protein